MQKYSIFKHYFILSTFLLLLSFYNINAQEKTTSLKNITGKVTNLNAALADVNIVIKNRNIGTKTNAKGAYVIQ
ncbi:MAG: carboxypeptidase-like regulatory domain-containing protein, partial [Flavobacteriaceae bacterium]|nr:carboxypeptidase-like regulatory domain-containing protein [Flavobacteriaceae bacterium]